MMQITEGTRVVVAFYNEPRDNPGWCLNVFPPVDESGWGDDESHALDVPEAEPHRDNIIALNRAIDQLDKIGADLTRHGLMEAPKDIRDVIDMLRDERDMRLFEVKERTIDAALKAAERKLGRDDLQWKPLELDDPQAMEATL